MLRLAPHGIAADLAVIAIPATESLQLLTDLCDQFNDPANQLPNDLKRF